MANIEFSQQYKHPEWQKKRLEALSAAEFTCQRCFIDDEQLHVHHKRYVKGRKIWEYEISELEVLCNSCHESAHQDKDLLNLIISRLPSEGVNEINALLIGYIAWVDGPGGAANLEDLHGLSNNPWTTMIGHVAALLSNRTNVDVIMDLSEKLYSSNDGDEITFSVPIKKTRSFKNV